MPKKTFKIKDNLIEALDDTVTSACNNAGELYIEIVPIRKIQIDPANPRKLQISISDLLQSSSSISVDNPLIESNCIEKESLFSIAKSISEQGVINPVLVYREHDHFRLIAGQRRTLASILAGKNDIPAKILDKKPSSLQISQLQWIENMEREDLTLQERMNNIDKIIQAYKNLNNDDEVTPSKLSELLGCSLQQAVNYNHILNASDRLKYLIQTNQIRSIDKAATISKSPLEKQTVLIDQYLSGATLKELKQSAHSELKSLESNKINENKKKKAINYNLGKTKDINVIVTILHSITTNPNLEQFSNKFPFIDFNNQESILAGWHKIINLLEELN